MKERGWFMENENWGLPSNNNLGDIDELFYKYIHSEENNKTKYDVSKMKEEDVINLGYAKYIYEYALMNPNANMNSLATALVSSKLLPECYSDNGFLDDEEYDDEIIFIDKPLSYYCYKFAKDIKNVDIKIFEKHLSHCNEDIIKYFFARDIDGANVEALERFLEPKTIFYFACDIKGADIKHLEEMLMDWLDEEGCSYDYFEEYFIYILNFAKYIQSSDIDYMITCIQEYIEQYGYSLYSEYLETFLIKKLEMIKKDRNQLVLKK